MPVPPTPSITILERPVQGTSVKRYIERPEKYSHTIGAWLGYDDAKFSLSTTQSDLNFWFDAVGMKVEVHAPGLNKIWEGFIDEVKIDVGPLSYSIGPLMDMCNNLLFMWSAKVPEWANPQGTTWHYVYFTLTPDLQRSRDKYGNIWQYLNIGAATPDGADAAAQAYLESRRYPRTSWDVSDRSKAPSVSVRCKGFIHWLNWYEDTWADWFYEGGTADASTFIHEVLSGNPNSAWFGIDETHLQTNAAPVPASQPIDMTALEKIKEAVGYGGGSPNYERWLFGMYNDYRIYYEAAPTDVEYELHLTDDRFALQAAGSTETRIWPWDVRPGKWVLLTDFLPGLTLPDDYWKDPRLGFIEEVVYTAPHGLKLKGADFDVLDRVLAYWGLESVIG